MNRPKSKMPPPTDSKGTPQQLRAQPGYYTGYSTLSQKDHWDEATRNKIEARVNIGSELKFFTAAEGETLQNIIDCVLPQSDRDAEHQIPILQLIDERLSARRFDGYIFEGCPEADVGHKLGLKAVEAIATEIYKRPFTQLAPTDQESLLIAVKDGTPPGNPELWKELPPKYYWSLVLQDAVTAYYAHPFAWDEIGFGGPAYPRGYMRRNEGKPEPWEVDEKRYEWYAPDVSRSDQLKMNDDLFPSSFVRKKAGT